jgi:hypothetical protein
VGLAEERVGSRPHFGATAGCNGDSTAGDPIGNSAGVPFDPETGFHLRYGEEDMRTSVVLSIGIGLYFLAVSMASARPIKISDLAGKTICWPGDYVEKYTADGNYTSNIDGPGKGWYDDKGRWNWKLEKYSTTFVGDVEINDDGTVTYTGSEPGNDNATEHGEFCNK